MGLRERRAAPRYPLELPFIVRRENEVLNVKTRNISTGGIYFSTDRHLAVGEAIDFSLTFVGLIEGEEILFRGRARVLRVVPRPERIPGVAALIESLEILRTDQI